MPKHLGSMSPLPSGNSFTAVSKAEVRKLYYRTAYEREVPGKILAEEDRGENYLDIHALGQRTSKYMEYQLKRAPLLNRNACQSTRDFTEKPLGDFEANRMLAGNFKEGGASAPKNIDVVFHGRSQSEVDFPKRDNQELERARQKSATAVLGGNVFVRTKTLGGSGYSMEKQSHAHMRYVTPDLKAAKPVKVIVPRQNLDLGGSTKEGLARTAHQRSFAPGSGLIAASAVRNLSQSPSAPELRHADSTQPFPVDPAVLLTRRVPFQGPGQ